MAITERPYLSTAVNTGGSACGFPSRSPVDKMSSTLEEAGVAGHHMRGPTSPSLSSSSHTPSSCNLDDVNSHDLSDVSSLDGSEFEIIDVDHRPASSLSARSRENTAEAGGAARCRFESQLLGDHADQWAAVARHETLADGSHVRMDYASIDSEPRRSRHGDADVSSVFTEQDAAEADLLNRSLTSTFALSRHEQQDSGPSSSSASTCIVTPLASVIQRPLRPSVDQQADVHRTDLLEAAGFDGSEATPSILAASQFTFPDPLSLSNDGEARNFGARGPSLVASGQGTHDRWTPVPSEARPSLASTISHPSEKGWNRARMPATTAPTATASSLGFNTVDRSSEAIPAGSRQAEGFGLSTQRRPVRKTHVELPAAVNVYYLGRRPAAAVLWRISQAVKASLSEAVGAPLQHHSREVVDRVVVTKSAAGNAFGQRVLYLKEVDCTEPHDEAADQSALLESYLRGPAAEDVAKGNALIICCLENGEVSSGTRLPHHLANLLEVVHVNLSAATADSLRPLVLPVYCPKAGSVSDDATSVASWGQRELVRQLDSRINVQAIDQDWSSTLAETLRSLKAHCSAPHLHVQFAPGTAFVRVIGFDALVSASATWFRGDTTWACRAAMPLSTTSNSPLVLLQEESRTQAAQAPPAWLIKTKKWLSRGVHPAIHAQSGSSSLASSETKQSLGEKVVAAAGSPVERGAGDLECLSSRAVSRHRAYRAILLVISMISCVALLGSGGRGIVGFLGHGSLLSRFPLSPPSPSQTILASSSSLGNLTSTTSAPARYLDRFVVPAGFLAQPVASFTKTTATQSHRSKAAPSKAVDVRRNPVASKAVALRNAVNQSTGLAIYRQFVFGEPAPASSAFASSKALDAVDGTDTCRRGRSCRSPGPSTEQDGAIERLVWLMLNAVRGTATSLIVEARLSWKYWSAELRRVYFEDVMPAQQFYKTKMADASMHASQIYRTARTMSRAFADKQKREANIIFADAVKGAGIVDDMVRSRARDGKEWARTVFQDMTRGAAIVSDVASARFSSAAEDLKHTGESLTQQWKAKNLDELRHRASSARGFTEKLWGSAMKHADEQLEYWLVSDEHY